MVGSGYMPAAYKSLLLPGIIAISMVFTGIWAVAMPLIAEFQWTREIEDRLLAPIGVAWIAIEKVIAGMLQALVAGLIVIPLAWLVLRPGVEISIHSPLTFARSYADRVLLRLREGWPWGAASISSISG
jgi:ABC-2 type transport system permease protein